MWIGRGLVLNNNNRNRTWLVVALKREFKTLPVIVETDSGAFRVWGLVIFNTISDNNTVLVPLKVWFKNS